MSRKMFVALALLALALNSVLFAHAQLEEGVLAYGDQVEGEITDREFEVEYTFQGQAGDFVLVQMRGIDTDIGLSQPAVLLLDPDGEIIAEDYGFGDVFIGARLAVDGEYLIIATRKDGRAGDSVGQFLLELASPSPLKVGAAQEGTLSSELFEKEFFAVASTENFEILFTRTGGDLFPSYEIYVLDDDKSLDVLATAQGNLESLTMGLMAESSPDGVFFIIVETPFYQPHKTGATFTVALELSE